MTIRDEVADQLARALHDSGVIELCDGGSCRVCRSAAYDMMATDAGTELVYDRSRLQDQLDHERAGCRCSKKPTCAPHGSDRAHHLLDLCDVPHGHMPAFAQRRGRESVASAQSAYEREDPMSKPALREWQDSTKRQRGGYRRGDVVIVATLSGHPHGFAGFPPPTEQAWRLARVGATRPVSFDVIVDELLDEPETRLTVVNSEHRYDSRQTYSLTITELGTKVLRQRDAWRAYVAEGRPVWPDRDTASDWVRRFMAER